ncbi:unnamed protein product [Clonostachys chloroleuca]|uniref:Extracellular serine-rich protein n=1 Tax=Clonostachys chloroleuca TaxID=1926264 RepID=A0AA35PYQ2_9HYPO|nr:unnamed protein product [Clonostachys chloroleuca]
MRYLSIAVAALGLFTVGEAKRCKPRPSTTLASNIPTSAATPTSTPGPDTPDYYIDNPNFSLGLAYYTPSGNVSWVGDDGYDGDGSSKDGTAQLTTNGNDDDNTDASPVQKRDLAGTSISATVKNLVASSPYTISFHYLVLTAKPDNSCRLRAYFNGNNFANTERFPLTQKPSTSWSLLSGTVIPSSTTGTFTISLNCNAPGFAVAYIDSLRVVKGAAVVSSTTAQASSSSSVVASLSTPVSSSTGAAVSSATPVSSPASSSQASSTTPASASNTPSSSSTGSSADSTTPAASPSSAATSTPDALSTTPGSLSSSASSSSDPVSSANTPSSTPTASSTDSSSTPVSSSADSSTTPVASSTASSTPDASSAASTTITPAASSTASSTPDASSTASSGTPSSSASSTPSSTPGSSSTPVSSSATPSSTSAASSTTPSSTSASSTTPSSASSSTAASSSTPVASSATPSSTSVASSTTPSSTSVASSTTPSSTPSSTSSSASSSSASSTTPVSTASSTSTPSATPTSSTLPSATVDSTVLIIAKDAATAKLASDGLNAYGIPFQNFIVAQAGSTLPVLNSSLTSGNYGGIIVMSSVAYNYGGTTGWQSAITTDQWTALNNYQLSFKVRMVRIDEYPGASFGTTPGADGGCCTSPVTQNISFSDTSDFPTAQLKANVKVGTDGLYHVPATITDSSTTKAVAVFTPDSGSTVGGVAAVINNFNGREQFVWFISWATDWSPTSNWLQHAHIHWMTRGVFVGKRKVHLSDQIDDMQLSTEMFYPTNIPEVKIGITDLEAHVDWQTSINSRLPAGSDFWLEIGHNGNGDIINSTLTDDDMNTNKCNPPDAVYWDQVGAPNEWRKPLGTGEDVWPTGAKYETFSWSLACAKIDQFALWFTKSANLNHFAHLSHTFSHMSLNNATYHDAKREIQFNQAWMKLMGIDAATRFTANGIIPPAITGLNNGDSIQALMDNGIKHVVGDNTRPATRNPNSVYWPLISTYATNGYDGLTIIPRFSSRIYFNCHTPECTTREWIQTSAGSGDFNTLLALEKSSSTRNLLALQSDPYMFHQANMYTTGNDIRTIGDQTRRMSLVMAWTETVVQEMIRLTNWPITSQTQDQMVTYFTNRMTLDACSPKMSYVWSNDGKTLQKVVVTANGNTCSTPIPVTIPKGSVTASGGSVTSDVVGAEPPIQWVTLNGSPVTLTLSNAVTTTTTTSS